MRFPKLSILEQDLFKTPGTVRSVCVLVCVLVLMIGVLAACQNNGIPVMSSPPPPPPEEGVASLPPLHGPKYPEQTQDTSPLETGSGSAIEEEWRKMLEPYLKDQLSGGGASTSAPGAEMAAPGGQAPSPGLTPITGGAIRVGLLLPLSGPSALVGNAMLNAAQMALFDFADADFELLPHDTAGVPEEASYAASLAISDGASLIIGPLLSRSAQAIRPMVQTSGVPVISFSSDGSIAGNGLYTLGFLPRNEVERVTSFALSRGHQRFAVLAPNDPYGRSVVQSVSVSMTRYGGSLVDVAYYDRAGSNIEDVVRRLADYDNRREALFRERELLEDKEDELSRKALERLSLLETLGDLPYDALLIADGGDRLLQVAALLPFYDIDPGKVQIMGTGQWDVPGIGAEPALLGAWFAAPPPKARTQFQQKYAQIYGNPPHRLATLAYDATALAAVLARNGSSTPFAPEAMMQPSGFSGRDGVFRFAPDGTADRRLAVLQVDRRENIVVDPAPSSFVELSY